MKNVPSVDLDIGVGWGEPIGHVALHPFELSLLGGVIDGACEGIGVLLPLRSVLPHHHNDPVPVLHKSRCLPEQEGLPSGLDERGEPVEVSPHRGRALGLLLMLLAAPAARQGGGDWVHGRGSAETLRLVRRRGAVVPVVVPVVIAAVAGVEAASPTAAHLESPLRGRVRGSV